MDAEKEIKKCVMMGHGQGSGKSEALLVMLKFQAQMAWKRLLYTSQTSVLDVQTEPELTDTTPGRLTAPMRGLIY